MSASPLRHVGQAGVARARGIDAAPVVGDRDAHPPGLAPPGYVDAHGGGGRVCVAGDVRQALANDGDDVVGQVWVDAPVELVDDDELVIQVRVDGVAVKRDEQRGRKTEG